MKRMEHSELPAVFGGDEAGHAAYGMGIMEGGCVLEPEPDMHIPTPPYPDLPEFYWELTPAPEPEIVYEILYPSWYCIC